MREKINWALIGAGAIANKRVAPAIVSQPKSNLFLIVDKDISRAKQLADLYECKNVSDDFEDALKDRNIDAVYIATPVYLHASQTIMALKAGKHVICEKPLALDYNSALEVVKESEKASVKSTTAYFRRFYPKYIFTKDMIKSGFFGKILLIKICYHTYFSVDSSSTLFWRTNKDLVVVGIIADMGSHMFDVLIGLLGLPSKVFAKMRNLVFNYDVEDSSAILMEYENGALLTASFNWNSKTYSHEFEIIGTEKKIRWISYDGDKIAVAGKEKTEEIELPNHKNVHYPLIEDFVTAVVENRNPLISMREAAKTNLLIDACYKSSNEKREVDLKEFAS